MTYDLIVLLGSQPDIATWEFPEQVHACVERTKKLLEQGLAPYIATSGMWSISIDALGLKQPFRECDALAELLVQQGVDPTKILKEDCSRDTISNLYYLKTGLLIPRGMIRLLFVVADFRIPRLQFLCERILGPEYVVGFDPIESELGASYNEPQTFQLQEEFLKSMHTGDHEWLADKFFTAPMYQQMAKLDREKYRLK